MCVGVSGLQSRVLGGETEPVRASYHRCIRVDWAFPLGWPLADVLVEVVESVGLMARVGSHFTDAGSGVLAEACLVRTEEAEKKFELLCSIGIC